MTSQFPAPPPGASRLLLVLDGPLSPAAGDGLASLVAGYGPVLIGARDETGLGGRLARTADATLQPEARLAGNGGDAGALAAVRSMLAEHVGECVAVVASEGVVRTLLCEALGIPLAAAWRFQIEAGAVTVVEVGGDGRWALVRFNERGDPART